MTPVLYSLLDLAPIVQGGSPAQSFRNTLDLAQHAQRWGYHRYWLAEHHNIPGIASAATAVVIGHVAGATFAARDRRAVRNARIAVPGPDRPRRRARAGRGHAHGTRAAPRIRF